MILQFLLVNMQGYENGMARALIDACLRPPLSMLRLTTWHNQPDLMIFA